MFLYLEPRRALSLAGCVLLLGATLSAAPLLADDHELPSPEEITARYIEALGGEEAVRSHTSSTIKATFEMPAMGMSGETTIYQMAPDKYLESTNIAGVGEMLRAYNGEIGWAIDPMQGTRLLDGQMLKDIAREARFYAELEYDDTYPEQTAVGEADWNGQTTYQVDLVDEDGNESSHYFAKETGLLIGIETTQTNEMGTTDITISSSDYKEFGRLVAPSRVVISFMGMELTQTIESVTWDDVTLSVFEPSEAIKVLLPE